MRAGKGKREDKRADAPREGMGEEREEEAIGEEEAKGKEEEQKGKKEEKKKRKEQQREKTAQDEKCHGRGRRMPR